VLATPHHPLVMSGPVDPLDALHLSPYVEEPRPVGAAVYRRRRAVAALLLALVVAGLWSGARQVVPAPGGDPAPASGGEAVQVHVVQPGDTMWSVARALQPGGGDLRPLVDALVEANGGSALLRVGQRLTVPAGG